MRINNEVLDAWAERLRGVNGSLLRALAALQAGRGQTAMSEIRALQQRNILLVHELERAGAAPAAPHPEASAFRTALGLEAPPETPLRLLSSQAAERYAVAIRAAAEACRQMEMERGIEDGLTEYLDDLARSAEFEVSGPVGLREG